MSCPLFPLIFALVFGNRMQASEKFRFRFDFLREKNNCIRIPLDPDPKLMPGHLLPFRLDLKSGCKLLQKTGSGPDPTEKPGQITKIRQDLDPKP